MSIATFDGNDLGLVKKCETAAEPVARQESSYPGVVGVESLWLGGRGGRTTLETLAVEPDVASLVAWEEEWETYQQDGAPYVLVTDMGRTFAQVVLERFTPHGDPRPAASAAVVGWGRKYTFVFRHLI